MIRCIGQVREGADQRFYVTVRGAEGSLNPFYLGLSRPFGGVTFSGPDAADARQFVADWIEKNCAAEAEVFGNTSVVFSDEGDAGLFWMTFTKKSVDD